MYQKYFPCQSSSLSENVYNSNVVFTMRQSYAFHNQKKGASGPPDLDVGGDSILTL